MELNVSRHKTSAERESARVDRIKKKANAAIQVLSFQDKQINLLADGLIALTKVLVLKGLITVDDLPPKAVETAQLWDNQINPILAAMQTAIDAGTLPEDFNP